MNDKEKLEAIKKVLSDTPARSGNYQETAAWYEKALDEIDKIIESNTSPGKCPALLESRYDKWKCCRN